MAGENVDIIENCIGTCGRYQVFICVMILLTKFPAAWHQLGVAYIAGPSPYVCPDTGKQTCPCSNPQYKLGPFTRTIISEFDLICNRKLITHTLQAVFQFGVLLGSIGFGGLADRFGRKTAILVAVVLSVVTGVASSYMPNYWSLGLVRMFNGGAVGGFIVVTFVIVMEAVATKHRPIMSAVAHIPFNLGHLTVPLIGYLCRDYKDYLLWSAIPVAPLVCYYFIIPESPLWLLATKKTEKAIKILERAAKVNRMPVENVKVQVDNYQASRSTASAKKGTMVDLLRKPNIRRNVLLMAITYMSCSFCFYGLSQYVGVLAGNVYLNVELSALISTVGTLLAIPLLKYIKRRPNTIAINIMCSLCLFSIPLLKKGSFVAVALAGIGVAGNFAIFCVVFLWCTELFPTVLRSNALGFCSMAARIGSMIAPYIVGLKSDREWLPPIIFGLAPVLSTIACFFIPETKGCELMHSLEEGENFGKNNPRTQGT